MKDIMHLLSYCSGSILEKAKKYTASSTPKYFSYFLYNLFKYTLFKTSRILIEIIIESDIYFGRKAMEYGKLSIEEYEKLHDFVHNEF